MDRIGEYRAWNIATHFDSHDAFEAAGSDAFQAVDGIGPKLADQLSGT
ncbi:MAG: helix-hairpin-helix domain-containing protein [Halorientalis sp.]